MADGQKATDGKVGDCYREKKQLLERRSYLKMAGAAVSTVAASSAVGAAAGGTTRHDITFDRVVDAVDDLGLDPSGGAAVNGKLESGLKDGTLVKFPEGEYQFDSKFVITNNRVGFVGKGDVKFVPPNGFSDLLFDSWSGYDDILIENVDIDIRDDGTTAGMRLRCKSRFHIQDVEYLGRGLTNNSGQVSAFVLAIGSESGKGVLKNAVAKKGSRIDGYAGGNGRIGVWAGWSNKGTIRIEGCDFREFGNNGTYTCRTPGDVEIVDSYFLNNNASNIRIGGKGSYVENCTVEIDMSKYTGPSLGDLSKGFGIRGIHVDQGVQQDVGAIPAGAEIRNCEIIGKDAPSAVGLINLSPQGRSLKVVDTRIKCDIDNAPAVRRGKPGAIQWRPYQRTPPKPHWIRLENVSITGSASGREAVRVVGADDSIVRNCCIHQSGANRTGVKFVDSQNCTVDSSTIDVTGTAVDHQGSTVHTTNLTREGSCPVPETGIPDSTSSTDGSTSSSTDGSTSTSDKSGKELVIDGGGTYDRVEYAFSVDGSVEAGDLANTDDTIDGTSVSGQVEGGRDSYWVTGEFTEFQLDGDIPVRLDGDSVDPAALGSTSGTTSDGSSTESSTNAKTLVIDGGGTYDRVEYTFSVDGSVEAGDLANTNDTVKGTSVSGQVEGGRDAYEVTGEFTEFQLDGDIPVRLDGESVDPATLGSSNGTKTLVIDGSVTYDRVGYAFSVDGSVEAGDLANTDDTIDGTSVSGQVEGGRDAYEVTGEFTEFQLDGDVPVRLDGEPVDPATLSTGDSLPHEVKITGNGEKSTYEIEASGSMVKLANTDGGDTVSGSTASGAVGGGSDSFGFSGEIVRMQVDGNASVTFEK